MANMWGGWLALVGGIIALIAQWSTGWYGAAIGGILAVIGALGALANK